MTTIEITRAFHELRVLAKSIDVYSKKQARSVERVCSRIVRNIQSDLTTVDLTNYLGRISSRFEMKNVVAISMYLLSVYGERKQLNTQDLEIMQAIKDLKVPFNRRILLVRSESKSSHVVLDCPMGIPDNIDVLWEDFFADYFEKGPIHFENCFMISNMHDWSTRGDCVRIERANAGYWGFRYNINVRLK